MIYLQGPTKVSSPCVDILVMMWWTEPMDRSALWPPKHMLIKLGCDLQWLGFKNISNLHSSCLPLFQQGRQLELTFQSLAKFSKKTPNISSAINWIGSRAETRRRIRAHSASGSHYYIRFAKLSPKLPKNSRIQVQVRPCRPNSPMAWTCRTPTNQWLEPAD